MSVVKYIGRTTDFKGKTLWEIVANLKGNGVGRTVVRSMFERYPEPSFMKIVKVEADVYAVSLHSWRIYSLTRLFTIIATAQMQSLGGEDFPGAKITQHNHDTQRIL
jgi:hypothetical protein